MSQLSNTIIEYIPCPKCRADGRDRTGNNLAVYDDGHGKCWAGHGFFPPRALEPLLVEPHKQPTRLGPLLEYTLRSNTLRSDTKRYISFLTHGVPMPLAEETLLPSSFPQLEEPNPPVPPGPPSQSQRISYEELGFYPWRGVTAETMKFFGVLSNDDVIIYPWGSSARMVRSKAAKEFWWEGQSKDSQGLFGMDRFVAGHNFVVTITEGALDAMGLWQSLGGKYPVVSVKSASSALANCTREFDWLNSFEKIKLALDNDAPGIKAAQDIARLFDVNKVYWVRP